MVIVDSSVWIDALAGVTNRRTAWLEAALGREEIGLTDLILCEVLQGARSDTQFEGLRQSLFEFPIFEVGGRELAVTAAKNYRTLRNRGITVRKTIDCFIATFCIRAGYQLLHNDKDFEPFEEYLGLRVLHAPNRK